MKKGCEEDPGDGRAPASGSLRRAGDLRREHRAQHNPHYAGRERIVDQAPVGVSRQPAERGVTRYSAYYAFCLHYRDMLSCNRASQAAPIRR
jgi:hypothetical protein